MPVRSYGGKTPILGKGVFVADTATVIGDAVIGDGSSIWFGTVVRADQMPIRIGTDTSIQDNSVIHVTSNVSGTTVGSRVTVGHRVILHACTVEDDCIIGMGSILLDRVVIGRGSIVGAGALVTPGTIVPPSSLILGAPAKVKRTITDEERTWIESSANAYVELTSRYLAGG